MPTLKEYNAKLARLRSTRKMTRTMKMVSTTKLRRAQEVHRRSEDFLRRLQALAARTAARGADLDHPLVVPRRPLRQVLCIVVTSDRGLCGGFNNNLNRAVAAWMGDIRSRCDGIVLSFCGRRGYLFFRNADARLRVHYEGLSARPTYCAVRRVGLDLQAAYVSGLVDEVYLAYTASRGASQAPVVERLFPLAVPPAPPEGTMPDDSLLEPSFHAVAGTVLGKLATARLYEALATSAVGEHRARMLAMDSSTTNADSLIESYTLLRNRARQAAITRELSEIVGGAEALK